jgi:photosynthetic reaction center cytochrome c subunit
MSQNNSSLFSRGAIYIGVWVIVTGVLLSASLFVLTFVRNQTRSDDALDPTTPQVFVDYNVEPDAYVDGASLLAMGNYIRDYPEPQNVQVLTGMSTAAIAGYMVNQVSAGMQVDCTHCHNIQNFAADEWDDEVAMQNKMTARVHLTMSADLNQNWLTQLADLTPDKHPSGVQISCATCHLGEAQPQAWPENQQSLPDDFRLPLDGEDILKVNARSDVSLDTVQANQHLMYYMNSSMGIGCTHCHNSRYFPSFEQPAKYYANHMLEMSTYIRDNYQEDMGGQEPSCNLCHYGNILPPGAVRSPESLPSMLTVPSMGEQAMSAPSN